MTPNNINEWAEYKKLPECIAVAVESAFTAYKESDTDAISEIFKNCIRRVRIIELDDIKQSDFNGVKLTDNDKRLLLNARLKFEIERMTSTFSRLIESYETDKLIKHFALGYLK